MKKSTSASAFFSLRVLISLTAFFAGIILALFATANPQASTHARALRLGTQPRRPDRALVAPSGGVQQEWVARYNGPGNGDDKDFVIAVNGSGNVYVTGYSRSLGGDYDYATIRYDSSGNQQWVARYNGPGNGDDLTGVIAIDGAGNVYVTGQSIGSGTGYDYATIKYDSSGNQQWVARYNGPGNGDDQGFGIAIDGSGNVYVTGLSAGSGTGVYDYATIKYDSSGNQQWVARYNGPGNGDDEGFVIAIDGSGNVYVTGPSIGSGTGFDYATVKYDGSGQEQWVARYNGPGNGDDLALAIAIDGAGNVYVTGQSIGSGTGFDYATVKYDTSGQEQRVARYNGPGNGDDFALAVAVDGSGSVYATGRSFASSSGYDFATVKYDSSGQEQWVARYNGPGNDYDEADAIAVDGAGNVYVTGRSIGSGTGYDYATIKYSQTPSPTPTPTATPTATPRATPTPRARPTPAPRPTPPQ